MQPSIAVQLDRRMKRIRVQVTERLLSYRKGGDLGLRPRRAAALLSRTPTGALHVFIFSNSDSRRNARQGGRGPIEHFETAEVTQQIFSNLSLLNVAKLSSTSADSGENI